MKSLNNIVYILVLAVALAVTLAGTVLFLIDRDPWWIFVALIGVWAILDVTKRGPH